MTKSEIVLGTREHAIELSYNIRPADAREIFAAAGRRNAYSCIRSIARLGGTVNTGLVDGKVACMFGVYRATQLSTKGVPWLLSTHVVDDHPKLFLRQTKAGMDIIKNEWGYTHLENYVDAEYKEAQQWLKWLGFTVHPAEPYGPFGLPFHRFEMRID